MGQQHVAFLTSQAAYIEPQVYNIQYPTIQYSSLVPIDTSAPPWAGQITYFSHDGVGEARHLGTRANDFPLVDTSREKHDVRIENFGIGYDFNEMELEYAMTVGVNLSADDAMVARRVAEEKTDETCLMGEPLMNWDGLINSSAVTRMDAGQGAKGTGAAAKRLWDNKTGVEIAKDVNDALSGIHVSSLQVELADTVLLPVAMRDLIATRVFHDGTDTNILNWIRMNNVYTAQTGRELTIRTLRGLESAGTGGVGRMIAYARDPMVLKFHMPMPLRFFPPQQWLLQYVVPGMFRLGGLEIRRPGGVRYVDGINAA